MLLWRGLNYAWSATFHCNLHPNGLEKWPETGTHAFTKAESKWLAETLSFLERTAGRPARSSGVRRALETAPPPPGKATSVPRGSRKDEAAQGASRKRSAGATVKTSFAQFRPALRDGWLTYIKAKYAAQPGGGGSRPIHCTGKGGSGR